MNRLSLAAAMLALAPVAADANELFAGAFVHDVESPLTKSGIEGGVDLQLGWRGERIAGSPFQPYLFGSFHSEGQSHFVAAGISARFGDRFFIRPGIGIALHGGAADEFQRTDRIAFGSRILFEPELGIGARLSERLSIEASIVHLSHGRLFSAQNPGMDSIGARLTVDLP